MVKMEITFTCDGCGAVEKMDYDDSFRAWYDETYPEGWGQVSLLESLQPANTLFDVKDCCPTCLVEWPDKEKYEVWPYKESDESYAGWGNVYGYGA